MEKMMTYEENKNWDRETGLKDIVCNFLAIALHSDYIKSEIEVFYISASSFQSAVTV